MLPPYEDELLPKAFCRAAIVFGFESAPPTPLIDEVKAFAPPTVPAAPAFPKAVFAAPTCCPVPTPIPPSAPDAFCPELASPVRPDRYWPRPWLAYPALSCDTSRSAAPEFDKPEAARDRLVARFACCSGNW